MLSRVGIPVILLCDSHNLGKAHRLGSSDVLLEKPVRNEELLPLVNALANRRQAERSAVARSAGAGS